MFEDQSLVLSDGRTLSFTTFGAAPTQTEEPTVFYFHGFPGTHHEGRTFHESAAEKGIRVVAISRPGFGKSTYQADRTILSFPQDVVAVADHLAIRKFAVMGVSGGAPYALACVHAIPRSRLLGAAVVCGIYPLALGTAGMMLSNRVLFAVAPWLTGFVAFAMDWMIGRLARDETQRERYHSEVDGWLKSRPAEDVAVALADDGKILKALEESLREAFRDGPQGSAWEARLFGSPWGFELEDLEVEKGKLVLWHGAKDVNCPVTMAEKAAAVIPNAELRVGNDEAHLSMFAHRMDEIAAKLLEMMQ